MVATAAMEGLSAEKPRFTRDNPVAYRQHVVALTPWKGCFTAAGTSNVHPSGAIKLLSG